MQEILNPVTELIENNTIYQDRYQKSKINLSILDEILSIQPKGKAFLVFEYGCFDSIWNVPIIAKIADILTLAGWEWDAQLRQDVDEEKLRIRKFPTLIIMDPVTGEEIGRMTENPLASTIEEEILLILKKREKLEAFST